MKTITFFGGASPDVDSAYLETAHRFGKWLGAKPCRVKYGGSSYGIMGAFARGVLESSHSIEGGADLLGILPKKYMERNRPEMLEARFKVVDSLAERKTLLIGNTDLFVVFPGGTGTFDEIFETLEEAYMPPHSGWADIGEYKLPPLFILNQNGYFDGILAQTKRAVAEKFLPRTKMDIVHFFDGAEELEEALSRFFET